MSGGRALQYQQYHNTSGAPQGLHCACHAGTQGSGARAPRSIDARPFLFSFQDALSIHLVHIKRTTHPGTHFTLAILTPGCLRAARLGLRGSTTPTWSWKPQQLLLQ